MKKKTNLLPIAGTIAAVLLFILIKILPLSGFTPEGQGVLAIMLAGVVLWITRPITMAFTALLVILIPWALGYISPEVALSGFSSNTFWLVFAVLGMGSCVSASPLSKRLFLTVLSLIGRPTFKRVLLVGFGLTFVLGYFIPLSVAKTAILFAILLPIVPLFGVPMKSRLGSTLAVSFAVIPWATMALTPTAHIISSLTYGVLIEEGANISFMQWAAITFIPTVLVFAAFYLFVIWYSRPEAQEAVGGRKKIREDLKALPPMNLQEIWVLVITLGIFSGWMAGLNTTLVALVGVLLYVMPRIGVMSFSEFIEKGINWETLIMVGAFLSITPMLGSVGLTETFKSALFLPFSFASTPLLFVAAMALLALLTWGLMIIFPAIPLVVPIVMVAAPAAGVNPVLGGMMLIMFAPQFFFWITAPSFGLAMSDDMVDLKTWFIYTGAFFLIVLVVWGLWVWVQPVIGLAAV